jgi:hypothetical protein
MEAMKNIDKGETALRTERAECNCCGTQVKMWAVFTYETNYVITERP